MGVALQSHTKINMCCKGISCKLRTVLWAVCYVQGCLIFRKIQYLNFTFTIQLFFLFIRPMKMELTKSFSKRRHIKFRHRRITQKIEYNIQHISDITFNFINGTVSYNHVLTFCAIFSVCI